MVKKTNLLIALVLLLSGQNAMGEQLSPTQALSRLNQSKASHSAVARVMSRAAEAPVYTARSLSLNKNCFYVFQSSDAGYMIVSADDCVKPLLGYVDNGSFDIDNIAPSMKWWLDEYSRQIEWAIENQGEESAVTTSPLKIARSASAEELMPIAPLVTTKWNQDSPYNLQTPLIDEAATMTGCMATAMAQIAAYHKYPACGKGSISYTDSYSTAREYNFEEHPFDWDNMLDTYDSSSSEESQQAVATLMAACGYAVRMNYGTSESGAYNAYMVDAFVTYLGYSPKAVIEYRDDYTIDAWNDMVYNELKNKRPVLYTGQSSGGGHAFVCDGYSSDGYFHMNWGWGGTSDGYFLLTALDPSSLGIGGGSGGYNSSQSIAMKLMPAGENDAMAYVLRSDNVSFSLSTVTSTDNVQRILTESTDALYNYTTAAYTGSLGMCFENLSTQELKYVVFSGCENVEMASYGGTYKLPLLYSDIKAAVENGEYKAYPVYTDGDGEWEKVRISASNYTYVLATVNDESVDFAYPSSSQVGISNFTFDKHYIGQTAECEFDVTASGYYRDTIYAAILTISSGSASVKTLLDSRILEVSDETQHIKMQYSVTDNSYDSSETYYLAILYYNNGTLYIGTYSPIALETSDGALTVNSFSLETFDYYQCYRNKINVSINVTASGGTVNDYVTFYIIDQSGHVYGLFNSEIIKLSDGETGEYTSTGSCASGVAGDLYYVCVGKNYSLISSTYCPFFLVDETVLVSKLFIDRTEIELNVGETAELTAAVLPVDATNQTLEWATSDDSVVSVEDGVVTAVGQGQATVTVSTTDGSALTKECKIVVAETTGVEAIMIDNDARCAVYTLTGIVVNANATKSDLNDLPAGLYIVVSDGKVTKVAKR